MSVLASSSAHGDAPSVDVLAHLDPHAGLNAHRADWLRAYARSLALLDALVLVLAGLIGAVARFGLGVDPTRVHGVYLLGGLALVPVWLATMAMSRCYETRFLGAGSEEFKRVANASFRVVALVVIGLFLTKTDASRGFLALTLFTGLLGVVGGRYAARLWLHGQRQRGRCRHKVVVVGPAAAALEMTTTLQRQPLTGLTVVGACVIDGAASYSANSLIPVLGSLNEVLPVLERLGADTVVVAKGPGITSECLRQLTYDLEGTGVDLLVSPLLTNVTGSRITWRSVPGLPLLHVEEPELEGSRRLLKAAFDRTLGLLLLLAISPVLLGLAAIIRGTSSGPAFFRQERAGRSGATFRIWKLRTMYADAEARRPSLLHLNTHGADAVLFKIENDPRVTPIGRFLRRYSLDELPQLINVLTGDMSLVGPRPPLEDEVAKYEWQVHRRLLVKPGMTGLWQVSGRADLPWEEAVRLDLHYVENWSIGLDLAILFKTAITLFRPSGAY